MHKLLVAGVGNIFYGDDGFGPEVAGRFRSQGTSPYVTVEDFGLRGIDLAFALVSGRYDSVILVDALSTGREPGTLVVLDPDLPGASGTPVSAGAPDGHRMDPCQVLAWAALQGTPLPRVKILGCEPAAFGSWEEVTVGLTPPVRDAVERALPLLERLVAEAKEGAWEGTCTNSR